MMPVDTSILPETAATRYDVAAFGDVTYEAYHAELRTLRRQLLRMQEWALREGQRIVVVLEGRDAAGKGTTASAITRYLNPKSAKIISQGIPTPRDMRNWLGIHYRMMPEPGNIVVFDRSWYSRALITAIHGVLHHAAVRLLHEPGQ